MQVFEALFEITGTGTDFFCKESGALALPEHAETVAFVRDFVWRRAFVILVSQLKVIVKGLLTR